MDGSVERSIPHSELALLAPDIPEGVEKLGQFNTYSILTALDGSSATVNRLRKMGDQHTTGFKVVDQQVLTPGEIDQAAMWIAKAFDAVKPGKTSIQQLHQLDKADEIISTISAEIRAAQAKSSGEPSI